MAKNTLPPGPWYYGCDNHVVDAGMWPIIQADEEGCGIETKDRFGKPIPMLDRAILQIPGMIEELRAYHALLGETQRGDGDDATYDRIGKILKAVDGE